MKLRYVVGIVALAMVIVACTKPKTETTESAPADKATTEQVAKEAEKAAQTEPTPTAPASEPAPADKATADSADKANVKADAPADAKKDEPKADAPADAPKPDGELKAEDRVSEDQKY